MTTPHANRIEDNTQNIVRVALEGHGEFATSLGWIRQANGLTVRELARHIAACYEGTETKEFATPTYWQRTFPKSVLLIVYCGLNHPAN